MCHWRAYIMGVKRFCRIGTKDSPHCFGRNTGEYVRAKGLQIHDIHVVVVLQ